jgi:hypothetical protein
MLQQMTNNVRSTFSVGDTTPWFALSIEQDNQNWRHSISCLVQLVAGSWVVSHADTGHRWMLGTC